MLRLGLFSLKYATEPLDNEDRLELPFQNTEEKPPTFNRPKRRHDEVTAKEEKEELSLSDFLDQFTTSFTRHRPLIFVLRDTPKIYSVIESLTDQNLKKILEPAIALLKTKAPKYYALLSLYNRPIRAVGHYSACANYNTGTIDLGLSSLKCSPVILAAILIHETIHFWQKRSGRKKAFKMTTQAIELEAFHHEAEVLKLIGGTEQQINKKERGRGLHNSVVWQGGYSDTKKITRKKIEPIQSPPDHKEPDEGDSFHTGMCLIM